MKFKVAADELSSIAKVCVRGLNSKDPHSQSVLKLSEDKTKLYIFCTTQKTYFKGYVDVYDIEEGEDDKVTEWSVDGNQLKTILSILPSTASIPVEFNMENSARNFIIKVTGNKIKLPVYDVISPYKEEKQEKIAVLPANDFISRLTSIGKLVSTDVDDENTPLSCIHVIFDKDKIKLMGTNGYSIAEEQIDYKLEGTEDTILIPVDQIQLLSRVFEGSEDIVLIQTDTKIGYIDEKGIVSLVSKSSLSAISYESTKSRVSDNRTVTVNSVDFKQAVSALSKLAPKGEKVYVNVLNDKLSLTNVNDDVMNIEILESNSPEDEITFTIKSLINIENLFTDKIRIGWANETVGRLVQFSTYKTNDDDTEEIDSNVFIGVLIDADE